MTTAPPPATTSDERFVVWFDQLRERLQHPDAQAVLSGWRQQPLAAYAAATDPATTTADVDLVAGGTPAVALVVDGTHWHLRCALRDADTAVGDALTVLDEAFGLRLIDIASHRLPAPEGSWSTNWSPPWAPRSSRSGPATSASGRPKPSAPRRSLRRSTLPPSQQGRLRSSDATS